MPDDMATPTPETLILASASTARAALLRAAGIAFWTEPSAVDEAEIKRVHRAAGHDARACAVALAEAKAVAVAARHPTSLVIGADQILVAGDEWFDKPVDVDEAGDQLCRLRGRRHVLVTAGCVFRGETRLWSAVSMPALTMRRFSDEFLTEYIAAEGDTVLGSVGAYRIEDRGVQLFSRIEGDHFAILGLPLLELLEFLRDRGVLAR
ncbi:MAG TPA: Maf family nucleotide pyrophosphatase [Stellaceae bacterium]|nr:Maf family nucleotide pyrophosphatase [Stellaceae bacterium]